MPKMLISDFPIRKLISTLQTQKQAIPLQTLYDITKEIKQLSP